MPTAVASPGIAEEEKLADQETGAPPKSLAQLLESHRYRCKACGGLTRFDVVRTVTFKTFHHQKVHGPASFEELEVVSDTIDKVICRYCGHGKEVVELDESGDEIADQVTPSQ